MVTQENYMLTSCTVSEDIDTPFHRFENKITDFCNVAIACARTLHTNIINYGLSFVTIEFLEQVHSNKLNKQI